MFLLREFSLGSQMTAPHDDINFDDVRHSHGALNKTIVHGTTMVSAAGCLPLLL